MEKKSSQVSSQDTDCKERGNEPFCWVVEIGPKSCILCLWKRMTLTWLLLTCLKHWEWEPSCTPKLISQAYVSFLEISSVPALHLLSILYFTTSVKIFISSFHRKEFPFGKAMLRVGWLKSCGEEMKHIIKEIVVYNWLKSSKVSCFLLYMIGFCCATTNFLHHLKIKTFLWSS